MAKKTKKKGPKKVETLTHDKAKRKNIPTAELQSAAERAEEMDPFEPVTYARRKPLAESEARPRDEDLDPQIIWKGATLRLSPEQIEQLTATGKLEIGEAQLTWRGKDIQDWSDLVVQAPPLYIQEKIHPKVIIEDLRRQSEKRVKEGDAAPDMFDMFEDFNGIDPEATTEFYQHDQNWQNRMILGDSLQVMASLAEREGLRGKVQCIYFDPPYGIRFNSNWQVSTRSREVTDGKIDQVTREPEQVKAFRDTWADGIHSYLTYLRDRMTAMRDLLTESGSIFVQIGDENVHRVRALMDEVFGQENFVSEILVKKKGSQISGTLDPVNDFILFYCKSKPSIKFRHLFSVRTDDEVFDDFPYVKTVEGLRFHIKEIEGKDSVSYKSNFSLFEKTYPNAKVFALNPLKSGGFRANQSHDFHFRGRVFPIKDSQCWKHTVIPKDDETPGMYRLARADRLFPLKTDVRFIRYAPSPPIKRFSNWWDGLGGASSPIYVVQSNTELVKRCVLMTTDPGDIVLDPTCGSGTTAFVAEQWGRRWITLDTSRVALALARSRLMGARYPYYYLVDSPEGRTKEQEVTGQVQIDAPTHDDIRQGFVYTRAHWNTSGSIANNAEIDVIWEGYQESLEPLRNELNDSLDQSWEEWEIPREPGADWPDNVKGVHAEWWELRITRQQEIDKSIAQKADVELLYDRPYEDKSKVRVAGPFTVESLSPHRVVPADEGELIDTLDAADGTRQRQDAPHQDFTQMILENLFSAGVHQAAKEDRITFNAIDGWPGEYIAAEGHFQDGETEKRAAIFVGPEFGTVTRADLTAAAREANEARFDALIACGFNFDAHSSELTKMGPLPILKAKMNQDLHMSDELKNTGKGNLFTIIGEPDIEWNFDDDGNIVGRVRPENQRSAVQRKGRHRRLVHRHRLQRRKLLRPPRLFPGRQRSLQGAQDQLKSGDRPGSLGNTLPRHFPPVPETGNGTVRGEGDQSLWG